MPSRANYINVRRCSLFPFTHGAQENGQTGVLVTKTRLQLVLPQLSISSLTLIPTVSKADTQVKEIKWAYGVNWERGNLGGHRTQSPTLFSKCHSIRFSQPCPGQVQLFPQVTERETEAQRAEEQGWLAMTLLGPQPASCLPSHGNSFCWAALQTANFPLEGPLEGRGRVGSLGLRLRPPSPDPGGQPCPTPWLTKASISPCQRGSQQGPFPISQT